MYLSDVIASVESGDLDYSDANRRKILGSLRRTAAIYGAPARGIPADPDRFTKRWGKGKVTSFPIAHFASPRQFANWRSNVRDALAQASGAKAAASARRATQDTWTEVLAAFDGMAGGVVKGDLFNKNQRRVLERLADCARREGIASNAVTLDDVVRFRKLYCLTTKQKTTLGRSVILLDKLRALPAIAHLLPPVALGRLPKMRLANGERLAAMPVLSGRVELVAQGLSDRHTLGALGQQRWQGKWLHGPVRRGPGLADRDGHRARARRPGRARAPAGAGAPRLDRRRRQNRRRRLRRGRRVDRRGRSAAPVAAVARDVPPAPEDRL